ncbi:hypothetical protein PGT21_024964 [Puccinia graminis f. sp. tritici]|uniref:Roadblock/LAMTOR2 domain-containing protein n=2 Tax=Puccinia graminis f. sp. tritici TaxID=56615 RepID=E3JRJ5_PUCGT|nr:uncharacterized protein PGTG_00713 [Puccinia graminis f. sp. tritici CRL 75-36-700-3]EFP74757.2 hypothetical protein PGTG_00713 [Puccinia graminis f. sp. tritici CRL 75-36-700-3]KAA1114840.1 hypothetical protein PGT21_024964 [Puccinia graminis f. sp. tritici]KAA1127023.1 hypothetical protein PGTUg99_004249 [Puccinia graminis f. sp. tritici]
MLLNIEGTTSLLAQVVTPGTFLAALITLDGRVVAYHIHPSAIVADEDDEQSDGSDQAKIAAAIASGLWREDCYDRPLSSNSKTELANEVRNLDAVCELGQLRLNFTPPFLLVLVGKAGSVSTETLSMKAQLLQDQLKGPFSNI